MEKITGISRDRLRNYEKIGILKPQKDDQNRYRRYSETDIIEVMSVEYYRSMNLEVKNIKKIRDQGGLEYLMQKLIEKQEDVELKLEELKRIHTYLAGAINACKLVKENLDRYSIKPIPKFKVFGTLSDSTAFSEYNAFEKREDKTLPIFQSMIREIRFNDYGIIENRVLLIEKSQQEEDDLTEDLCVYTIVKEDIGGRDIMPEIFERTQNWLEQNKYEHKGTAYIRMLLFDYPEGKATSYLEVFVPIEKK